MTVAVQVRAISVNYGDVEALRNASITLSEGLVYGLVGMNGSGKSTLMKAIIGLLRPESGSVSIHGKSPVVARKTGAIAYVPQSEDIDGAFPISVSEVVMTGRYGHMGPMRRPRSIDKEAVNAALERVGLLDLAQRPIGQLSGGQKKRVFVARGIAQDATVMLLDEPFAGVDKTSEATITAVLQDLAHEGKCILVSTHDLIALPGLATESVLLRKEVLAQDATEIILRPENLVRAFGMDPLAKQSEHSRKEGEAA